MENNSGKISTYVSVLVAIGAVSYFILSSGPKQQEQASKNLSTENSSVTEQKVSINTPSTSTQEIKGPKLEDGKLPNGMQLVVPNAPKGLPADLAAQLKQGPTELPEDLKAQLNSEPPPLPDDLQAQIDNPNPPEIPLDIQEALKKPARTVTLEEVNNPNATY